MAYGIYHLLESFHSLARYILLVACGERFNIYCLLGGN